MWVLLYLDFNKPWTLLRFPVGSGRSHLRSHPTPLPSAHYTPSSTLSQIRHLPEDSALAVSSSYVLKTHNLLLLLFRSQLKCHHLKESFLDHLRKSLPLFHLSLLHHLVSLLHSPSENLTWPGVMTHNTFVHCLFSSTRLRAPEDRDFSVLLNALSLHHSR